MRNGPCSPWVDGSDVAVAPWVADAITKAESKGSFSSEQVLQMIADAVTVASEVLYELSGRVFTGSCGPVTVRPVESSQADRASNLAYFQSWSGSAFVYGWGGVGGYDASASGWNNPPEIVLGTYPVNSIDSVKIDGVLIPSNEYRLLDSKTLARVLPTDQSQPTESYGWPTWQRLDLPDDQPGTFSVTYHYGQAPPAAGQLAASKLAQHLVLPQLGDSAKYPQRVTSVQRQGISSMTVDVMDIVKTGKTGIYEVDLFLRMSNPQQNNRQASVWSPDSGRARRY